MAHQVDDCVRLTWAAFIHGEEPHCSFAGFNRRALQTGGVDQGYVGQAWRRPRDVDPAERRRFLSRRD